MRCETHTRRVFENEGGELVPHVELGLVAAGLAGLLDDALPLVGEEHRLGVVAGGA